MKLLTEENLRSLPPLYGTERVPAEDKIVRVKLFDPTGSATWYLVEYDPKERLAYGWAEIMPGCGEWGYISIPELESVTGRLGLGIERDLDFSPKRAGEIEEIG